MTYTRKSFSGNASPTTLTGSITSGATTIVVAAIANWPNTTDGPFIVTIDRGTTNEEKVKIASYTGTTLTVASGGRGWDGTTAAAHGANADIRCTIDRDTINNHETFVAGNGTVTPTASAIGDLAADGTSAFPAAGDHKHARENFVVGATAPSAPGDAESDGASVSPARADHKHARETFGGSAPPKASGTGGTGAALTLARSDHFHPVDGAPLGLTGATAATRYVGGTASGAPTTGTFVLGDFVIDQSGIVWICTTAGSPGTWKNLAPTASPALTGTPTAPTGTAGDNTTRIATDAFVQTAKQTLSLFGVGGAVYGGAPPARLTGTFQIQAGTENIVCNSSGALTLTYPHAFPNNTLALLVTPNQVDGIAMAQVQGVPSSTGSNLSFYAPGGGSPGAVNVEFSWLAIGF